MTCFLLLIFVLTACQTGLDETVPEFNAVSESSNFYSMEISFYSDTAKYFGYELHTPAYDALLKRINEVENKYNCTVSLTASDIIETLVTSYIAGGVDLCDALFLDALPFRHLAAGGYLMDLNSYSDIIDVNDSFRWGTKNVLEICAYNGHLYGITPAAWIDKLSPYYFLVITNNDILLKNGFKHPHEYYEDSTWNRTIFEEIVSKCADIDKGIYGIDTSDEFIGRMAVYSDGVGLIDEASGAPQSAWHSELVKDNLQWAADFVAANKQYITQAGESYDEFIAGNSAMALSAVYHFCRKIIFTSAMNDYSVMPFPCSDSAEPGTCGGFFSTGLDTISLISTTVNERETATVINDIWAPMDGCETQELLDDYYLSNVFFSETDIEILKNCLNNTRYNYWVEKAFDPIQQIVQSVISGKYTPSQAIDTYIGTADEYVISIIVPNEEGLETYFNN